MRRLVLAGAAAVAVLSPAAPAGALPYEVQACGGVPNGSWAVTRVDKNYTADATCGPDGDTIGVSANSGARLRNGTAATLTFTSPPGTSIVDFTLARTWALHGAPKNGDRRPYLLYTLGSTVFAGAGTYNNDTRDALKDGAWAAYPQGDTDAAGQVRAATWKPLAGYTGGQSVLRIAVGCGNGQTECTQADGGVASNVVRKASVTVEDPSPPTVTVAPEGLFAPGGVSAGAPVIVTATDASGIASVDVEDASLGPDLSYPIGGEAYSGASGGEDDEDGGTGEPATTDAGAACDFSKAKPCPDLARETVVADGLDTGKKLLSVRVTDAAGNSFSTPPVAVDVTTPADRGAPNGTNATEAGTLTAGFGSKGRKKRTVSYGGRPTVEGRLRNDAGQPVGGATVTVGTQDAGTRGYRQRGSVTTKKDGRFRFKLKGAASRTVVLGWRARENDVKAAARAKPLKLRVRGSSTIRAPRLVDPGERFGVSGRLNGPKATPAVRVLLQRKVAGRWRTVRKGKTNNLGRFKLKTRLRANGRLRVRLLATKGWPYVSGASNGITVVVR